MIATAQAAFATMNVLGKSPEADRSVAGVSNC
jgi:hypothetical protein